MRFCGPSARRSVRRLCSEACLTTKQVLKYLGRYVCKQRRNNVEVFFISLLEHEIDA